MRNAPIILIIGGLSFLQGCAADTEADSPGSCSLSCSQPRAGASNYIVERLNNLEDISIYCNADFAAANKDILPANGPVAVRFKVYEKVTFGLPTSGGTSDGGDSAGAAGAAGGDAGGDSGSSQSSGEGSGAAGSGPVVEKVPRAGLGFEPVVYGGLAVEQTNPEHKVNDTTASPFKFAGIVTPAAEWCSDSCGNITYEFWPYCRQGTDIGVDASVQVSGGNVDNAKYKFSFMNE